MIKANIVYRPSSFEDAEQTHEVHLHKLPSVGEMIDLALTREAQNVIHLKVDEICHTIKPGIQLNESEQTIAIKCSVRSQFDLIGLS